jgi:hypothetical protein
MRFSSFLWPFKGLRSFKAFYGFLTKGLHSDDASTKFDLQGLAVSFL